MLSLPKLYIKQANKYVILKSTRAVKLASVSQQVTEQKQVDIF